MLQQWLMPTCSRIGSKLQQVLDDLLPDRDHQTSPSCWCRGGNSCTLDHSSSGTCAEVNQHTAQTVCVPKKTPHRTLKKSMHGCTNACGYHKAQHAAMQQLCRAVAAQSQHLAFSACIVIPAAICKAALCTIAQAHQRSSPH